MSAYAVTTTTSCNRQTYEETDMARLKLNRPETVPTFVNLPRTTRDKLEAMIGQGDIKSLTDAMVVAIDAGTKQIQKQAAAKRPSDRP